MYCVLSAPFRTDLPSLSHSIPERKGLQGFVAPLPDEAVHSHTARALRLAEDLLGAHATAAVFKHPENHPATRIAQKVAAYLEWSLQRWNL